MIFFANIVVLGVINLVCLTYTEAWMSSAVQTTRGMNLFMGRAAAVRAATKAKTDGAKVRDTFQ